MTARLLTVAEAADRLGVSEDNVRARIKEGKLSTSRVGRLFRISPAAIDRFLAENAVAAAPTVKPRPVAPRVTRNDDDWGPGSDRYVNG